MVTLCTIVVLYLLTYPVISFKIVYDIQRKSEYGIEAAKRSFKLFYILTETFDLYKNFLNALGISDLNYAYVLVNFDVPSWNMR